MEIVTGVVSVTLFWAIVIMIILWINHITETKANTIDYGWAGYLRFKQEFSKGSWVYDTGYKGALFEKGNRYGWSGTRDEIFVGRIMLNGKGMIINNPVSYMMCMLHVRKYIKDNGMLPKKDKSRGKVKKWY